MKERCVKSYRQYLKKLKERFGKIKQMPSDDDVRKDLESFIAGNYDDMIMDAVQNYKPSVKRYVSQPYKPVRTIHTPTHTISVLPKPSQLKQKPQVQSNRQNIQKSESSKSKWSNQKSKGKERNAKQGIEQEAILIDGDNHINEGKKGIEKTTKDKKIYAFFSQEGAKKKFDGQYGNRPNVLSKLVKPGDQAVDNQIKSVAGNLLKNKNQKVTIISQDKGFDKYIEEMKKYGKHISRAKSVRDRKKNSYPSV